MVARTRVIHVDQSLAVVRDESEELAELAGEWDGLYEDERVDFSIGWSDAMSHLRTLEELRAGGDLTASQERDYAPVRRSVAELLPTMERLNLATPGVPLD